MHAVLERQLAALAAGDIEAVMANYTPDAALVRFDEVFAGTDRIRATLTAYLGLKPRLLDLTHYAECEDTLFYRAVMELAGRQREAIGTLVVRDGRIWRQTAGFLDV
ncbi:nuclear transport factor 2 family protein [Streptomyces lavendulae]|uniref:nuclear transport factor 2 family protein n=1 Tax=Streptomyces lavendulae TaxID=1914 RepID=UPI0033D9051C